MSDHQNIASMKNVLLTFIVVIFSITIIVTGASAQIGLISPADVLGGDEDRSALQSVPADANFVARTDVQGLMQDNTTNKVIESSSDKFIDSNRSVEDILKISTFGSTNETQNTSKTDIQIEDIGETIVFGKIGLEESIMGSTDYRGAIVEVDAEPEVIMEIFYNTTVSSQYEHRGQTILEGNSTGQVAVIDSGLYIVGSEAAIKDSIDTSVGEKESIDQDIIPQIDGDTHIHMVLYNTTDIFGVVDSGQLENVPIPNNVTLTYTTTDEDKILINMFTDSEMGSIPDTSNNETTPYEDINSQIQLNNGNLTVEAEPEDIEKLFSNFDSSSVDSILRPN